MDDGWWDDFVRHIVDRAHTPLRCDSCGTVSSDWYCRACVREREDVIRDIARAIGFDGETDAELIGEARSLARSAADRVALALALRLAQHQLDQARAAVGEAWFAGGATLAEAIQRKCAALESLGNPRT